MRSLILAILLLSGLSAQAQPVVDGGLLGVEWLGWWHLFAAICRLQNAFHSCDEPGFLLLSARERDIKADSSLLCGGSVAGCAFCEQQGTNPLFEMVTRNGVLSGSCHRQLRSKRESKKSKGCCFQHRRPGPSHLFRG
jgi:hypothetical protein